MRTCLLERLEGEMALYSLTHWSTLFWASVKLCPLHKVPGTCQTGGLRTSFKERSPKDQTTSSTGLLLQMLGSGTTTSSPLFPQPLLTLTNVCVGSASSFCSCSDLIPINQFPVLKSISEGPRALSAFQNAVAVLSSPASFIGSFFFCPRFLFLAYFILHVHLNIKICILKFCQFHRHSVYQRSDPFPHLQPSHLFQFTLSTACWAFLLGFPIYQPYLTRPRSKLLFHMLFLCLTV